MAAVDETTTDWKSESARLTRRRAEVRRWWHGGDHNAPCAQPEDLVGLCISGGGIRSATFGLGLLQGLARARQNAFARVDILSTVSGGSYIGTFLRSLFVPDSLRGLSPPIEGRLDEHGELVPDADEVAAQYEFAKTVLASDADKQVIEGVGGEGDRRRNPLWWLREHSRYLAPNGPSDYGYALAYLARNWLAMLYIFFIASLAVFSAVVLLEVVAHRLGFADWRWVTLDAAPEVRLACGACGTTAATILPISPLVLLLAVPVVLSALYSTAYWMTEAMSSNEPKVSVQWRNLLNAVIGTIFGAIVVAGIAAWKGFDVLTPWDGPEPGGDPADQPFARIIAGGAVLAIAAALLALLYALRRSRDAMLTGELRRHLTNSLAISNQIFLVILGLAIVDSAGASLEHWFRFDRGGPGGSLTALLLPILAFLIRKLPDWFGGAGKGKFGAIILRLAAPVSALAGILLFGMVAVAASAVAHGFTWQYEAWESHPTTSRLWLLIAATWVLAWLSGRSDGFINLSSLHLLYSSRLTRAYLGASNNFRLRTLGAQSDAPMVAIDRAADAPKLDDRHEKATDITRNQDCDYIQPYHYSRADLPAPLHIINCTINETIDPNSQIVSRDRKGDVISVEPGGIRIGCDLQPWEHLGHNGVAEHISLGQWCAISGAAASSGMGRLTNLGFALALTFANVRLGYWWYAPGLFPPRQQPGPFKRWLTRQASSFIYLGKEMTARYSLEYERKYLTDGGHFENSGAYALIRRRVPLMIVADNAADPDYTFGDLEALVRLARLDLGAELEVLTGHALSEFADTLGARDRSIFVDAAEGEDWRDVFSEGRAGNAYVLVMRATCDGGPLHILWLKPRLLRGLPPDVSGYALTDGTFPQQTTGDQFFDEAQWESYRKLGEVSMTRLLETCPGLLA